MEPDIDVGADRHVCEAGHYCGTVALPRSEGAPVARLVSRGSSADEIVVQLRILMESCDDYIVAVPSAARPFALIDVGRGT